MASNSPDLLDDLTGPDGGTGWEMISDRVMGGVSNGSLTRETVQGRPALRLQGDVSLANNGGFLQLARDLPRGLDPAEFTAITLTVCGNGEEYNLHLRTADVQRPWQSYRAGFIAPPRWTTHRIPFATLTPHRLEAPFDPATLHRIGLVAIGRAFTADLAVAELALSR